MSQKKKTAKEYFREKYPPFGGFFKYNKVAEMAEEYADYKAGHSLVMSSYHFPNGMVATYGWDEKQIPELQGKYTPELHQKIIQRSDKNTTLQGFKKYKK